jgi:ethanolamine utilization protein EutA
LFIEQLPDTNFERLKELSMDIAALIHRCAARPPYIIVLKEDAAAALGLLLRKTLKSSPLIVVDGIDSTDGDYIDIGKPISHSQLGAAALALPVVVKTIIFRN